MDNVTDELKMIIRQQAVTVFLNEFLYYCLANGDSDDVDNETAKSDLLELHSRYFTAAYNDALLDFTYNKSDDEIADIMQAHLNLIKDAMQRSELMEQLQDDKQPN